MADIREKNPHQDEIDKLVSRILPRIRTMEFAINHREPWLGNTTVDKTVIATIEACFTLADEDRNKPQEVSLPELDEPKSLDTTSEPVVEESSEHNPG